MKIKRYHITCCKLDVLQKRFLCGSKIAYLRVSSMRKDFNVGHKVQENNLAEHVSNTFLSLQRVSYDINNHMILCNYSIPPQCIIVPDQHCLFILKSNTQC